MTDMEGFQAFWALFPKKKSKGDARKAWFQTQQIRPPIDELLTAVDKGLHSIDWHKADREGNIGAFIPYPASWLRAEGWNDEYTCQLASIKSPSPLTSAPNLPVDRQQGLANILQLRQQVKI